tara:strand:- start:226 stop:534 length:309 start_codon:yes stop_codon:yes gene_type:complete
MSEKDLHTNIYTVSFKDLMDLWMENFHPFGTVLIIWDSGNHCDILRKCGLLVNNVELYNNKALTIEVPGLMKAYQVMDKLSEQGLTAYMQVYKSGKLISDNI